MHFKQLEIDVTECATRDVIQNVIEEEIENKLILATDEFMNNQNSPSEEISDESMEVDENENAEVDENEKGESAVSMEVTDDTVQGATEKDAIVEGEKEKDAVVKGEKEKDAIVNGEKGKDVTVEGETEKHATVEGAIEQGEGDKTAEREIKIVDLEQENDITRSEEEIIDIAIREHLSHFI